MPITLIYHIFYAVLLNNCVSCYLEVYCDVHIIINISR